MRYYWTCPDCGASLDPGEKCTCSNELPFISVPNDYGTYKDLYFKEEEKYWVKMN